VYAGHVYILDKESTEQISTSYWFKHTPTQAINSSIPRLRVKENNTNPPSFRGTKLVSSYQGNNKD
jgi:hypothetical protein